MKFIRRRINRRFDKTNFRKKDRFNGFKSDNYKRISRLIQSKKDVRLLLALLKRFNFCN